MKKVISLFWIVALSILCTSCSAMLADLGLGEDTKTSLTADGSDCDPDIDEDCEEPSTKRHYADSDEAEDDGFYREPAGGTRYRVKAAIEQNDVIPGMTRSDVIQSWGEPHVREFAGSGESGHERWTYGSRQSVRGETYLLFEDGKVVGWQRR